MRIILILVALALSLSTEVVAEIDLSVEINPTSGQLNDLFLFRVKVQGSANLSKPSLRGGEDFEVQYVGPERSVHIVNGKRQESVTFNYQLQPKQTGTLLTPTVEINYQSKLYKAGPKRVEVGEATKAQDSTSEVTLEQSLSKDRVYVGQQTVHLLELTSSLPLANAEVADHTFDGFWTESFEREQARQRYINGVPHTVHSLSRALFPLSEGKKVIHPRQAQAQARVRVRGSGRQIGPFSLDLFDHDFFAVSKLQQFDLKSNQLELEVLPLPPVPEKLKPYANDQILVGATTLSVGYNTDPIKVGEGKTLIFRLETFGNPKAMNDSPLSPASNYRIYPEQSQSETSAMGGELLTRKSFRVTVVPLEGGTFEIAPVKLLFFNPELKQYELAETRPIKFEVVGDPAFVADHKKLAPKQEMPAETDSEDITEEEPPQIQYRDLSPLERFNSQFTSTSLLWGLLLFCALVPICYLMVIRKKKASISKQIIEQIRTSTSPEQFLSHLLRYFEQIYSIKVSGPRELPEALTQGDFSPDFIYQLQSLLDEFTIIRYSGTKDTDQNKQLFEQFAALLDKK